MGGLEQLPNNMGFIPNLTFNTEKLIFHSFWNPSIRAQAHVCDMHMQLWDMRAQTHVCVHMP